MNDFSLEENGSLHILTHTWKQTLNRYQHSIVLTHMISCLNFVSKLLIYLFIFDCSIASISLTFKPHNYSWWLSKCCFFPLRNLWEIIFVVCLGYYFIHHVIFICLLARPSFVWYAYQAHERYFAGMEKFNYKLLSNVLYVVCNTSVVIQNIAWSKMII